MVIIHLFTMKALKIGELKIEVVDVSVDGSAKFRLWYEKWGGRYVDIDVVKQDFDGVNVYLGELRVGGFVEPEHLKHMFLLLRSRNIRTMLVDGVLYFTTAFRDAVLTALGYMPKRGAEAPDVMHLDGYRFLIGDYTVEFIEGGPRKYGFYAKIELPTRKDAEKLVAGLMHLGVSSYHVGRVVVMNKDSLFGLLALTGATPPGLFRLYKSPRLAVYAKNSSSSIKYYFATVVYGVWKGILGSVSNKGKSVIGYSKDRDVILELARAIKSEITRGDSHGIHTYRSTNVHALSIDKRIMARILRLASTSAPIRSVIVLEDGSVSLDGVGVLRKDGKRIKVGDIEVLLMLYRSLRSAGYTVTLYPDGVKIKGTHTAANGRTVEVGSEG